jgi:hypothetical protein
LIALIEKKIDELNIPPELGPTNILGKRQQPEGEQ